MIVVFGSINVDLVTRVPRIPAAGETVLGSSYSVVPGGKGANQALAAARAGAQVVLIGAVGEDAFADAALALLRETTIDLSKLRVAPAPTGVAFISVDGEGRNAIVVASGANAFVRAEWVDDHALRADAILLLQREAPPAQTLAVAEMARSRGARVILNAAPADGFDPAILRHVDVLIVNEHEAMIVAQSLRWSENEPRDIARRLDAEMKVATIATLGAEGAVAWAGGADIRVRPPHVQVVDTTAAGDAFCGAFAAALDAGLAMPLAMRRGVAAGSLACAGEGAQTSLPLRADIEQVAASLT